MDLNYSTKIVSKSKALEFLATLTSEWNISPQSQAICNHYVSGLFEGDRPIRLDRLFGALDNLEKAITEGEASFLSQKRGFRFGPTVDVIEFAESKEYFGQKGHLWPSTKDNLMEMFPMEGPAPFECVLGGAAGTGKSSTTWIAMGYSTYLIQNLWSPQVEFGLMPESTIFLVFQSLRLDTVTDALFIKLLRAIDNSPWFQKHSPRQADINSKIILPNNIEIRQFTGSHDAGLGKDIISAAVTEMNFMPVIKGSVRLQHSDKTSFDVGAEMYTVLRNRIETRFSQSSGSFPGRLIVDSARNYVGDFTDKKKEERDRDLREKGHSSIIVIEKALWEAKPGYENEPRFPVERGTDYLPPRILAHESQAEDKENIVWVPERHRKAFEENIEKALRDLAGVPSTKTGKAIPFPAEITMAQDKFVERTGGKSLFLHQSISLNELFEHGIDWSLLIDMDYLKRMIMEGGRWAVHYDMSLSQDATGFAIGRIIGTQVVERGFLFSPQTGKLQEIEDMECPIYVIDGVLRIYARPGEQIPINTCGSMVLELKKQLPILYGSADWTESAGILQSWLDNKINAAHVSVDRNPDSYFELKHAIQEKRIYFPRHEVLDTELRQLKRINKGGKVTWDHPETGSKDVADAMAAVVGVLQRVEHIYRQVESTKPEAKEEDTSYMRRSSGRSMRVRRV